jgi:hypothetical protein
VILRLLTLVAACGVVVAGAAVVLMTPEGGYPGSIKSSGCRHPTSYPNAGWVHVPGDYLQLYFVQATCHVTDAKGTRVYDWSLENGWYRTPGERSLYRNSRVQLGPLTIETRRTATLTWPPHPPYIHTRRSVIYTWTH